MQQAIEKARVLIEALPYIHRFRRRFVVVKIGGNAMDDEQLVRDVIRDLVFMEQVGMWPVLVHGGGPHISEAMKRAGIEPTFVHGRRVTTPESMQIVARVLIDEVSARMCELIEDAGGKAIPLNGRGSSFLVGRKYRLPEAPDVDLGLVGEITSVDREMCFRLADGGLIPVVAPIARLAEESNAQPSADAAAGGAATHLLNVNGDTAAAAIAAGLLADKLVDISNVPGVLRDADDPTSIISTLHAAEATALIDAGVIVGGMIPKVQSCIEAVAGGVKKAHVVSAQLPHALLLEIFTDKGIGTEIVA
jgi:acetylglutamate kinase